MLQLTKVIFLLLIGSFLSSINCNFSKSSTPKSSTSSTGSSISSSSLSPNSSALNFLYRPAHSPPSVSIWAQVVILHSLALVFAIAFYLLHRMLIYKLANVKAPPMAAERRYTVPRTARATTTATSTAAIVPTPAPSKHHKAAASSAVPAKKISTSKAASEIKQRGHLTSKVKK